MKKKVFGRKLGREKTSRLALFVGLATELILKRKIVTTKAKAKAIVPFIDRLVVLSKKDTLASKRQILKKLRNNKKVATELWTKIAPMFSDRSSGFTRIVRLPQRSGDMAEMARIEFVAKEVKANKNENVPTKEKRS